MLNISINQLDCKQTLPNYPDCVSVVHYTIQKTRGDLTASTYGTVSLSDPESDFTLFPNLTQEQVIGWCNFDMAAIEASLDAQLDALENPPVLAKPVPWGA